MDFVQLHLHTYFSILDGVASPENCVKKAKSVGMKSLAITDHGTMSGVLRFNNECVEQGIKPIIGCEFYVNDNRIKELKNSGPNNHLVLLAKNETGYKNLLKINYDAMDKGFYYRGRAHTKTIRKYHEGIICTTACLGSTFARLILADEMELMENKLTSYKNLFGDDFYIELHFNELKDQIKVTKTLFDFSKKLDIKCIMTGDCHYLERGDDKIQDLQIMINNKKRMSDSNVFRFSVRNLFFHSPEDYLLFNNEFGYHLPSSEVKKAIKNTCEVADKCNFKIETGIVKLPKFFDEDGYQVNADKILVQKCSQGLIKKSSDKNGNISDIYHKRARYELDVIEEKGFADYFLIIEDIIQFCKKNDIAIGAGRGSAAGSLVSYLLDIIKVDPIKHGLLFERFLNKDRKDPPDIDLDFESKRKPEIEEYLKQKYGKEKVAHIITFSTFQLKGAVRDVFRVYEKEKDAAFVTLIKKIPSAAEEDLEKVSLSKQVKKLPLTNKEETYLTVNKKIFDMAGKLVGKIRQKGSHAGGTVITPDPIWEYMPVDKIKGEIVTGFIEGKDYRELSDLGILKIDILGLETVDILKNAVELVYKTLREDIDLNNIDLEDSKLYNALNSYSSIGIFQFENQAIDTFMKRVKPFCFDDITVVNALYRPALINANEHERYIKRRNKILRWEQENGEEYTGYKTLIGKLLASTYGTIVFQEQFMEILHKIGKFTLEEADKARKTFKILYLRNQDTEKKKEDPELLKVTNKFKKGVKETTNMTDNKINKLVNVLAEFAEYSFNKSHSLSYSIVSMQTVFMREYYPYCFYSALLNSSDNSVKSSGFRKENKMKKYIYYIRSRNIDFWPIDINKSRVRFYPETIKGKKKIRMPLTFVPGIGESFANNIIEAAPFRSFSDFCIKELQFKSNKTSILNLIYIGTFDSLNKNRKGLASFYEKWVGIKTKMKKKDKLVIKEKMLEIWNEYKELGSYTSEEKRNFEKEICRFNVFESDGETLRKINHLANKGKVVSLDQEPKGKQRYCIRFESIKPVTDKNGKKMAFYDIEDWRGKSLEAVSFSNTYNAMKNIELDRYYAVRGYIDPGGKMIMGIKGSYSKMSKLVIAVDSLKNI